MEFKIGNIKPKNRIVLAPMAGISNQAFRTICKEMGAGLVYAEMVSDKGIQFNNEKTKKMCEILDEEHPIAMQIFGSNHETITASAKEMIKLSKFDILDVNMGCPVNKVIKSKILKEAYYRNISEDIYHIYLYSFCFASLIFL